MDEEKNTAADAQLLINAGFGRHVTENLGSYEGLTTEVALTLIDDRGGWWVADSLGSFEGSDYTEIALRIIEVGQGAAVANHLGAFFEAILIDEHDALGVSRLLAQTERETITAEEFEGLLQVARTVEAHEGKPRVIG
jgi:hypothetical protein